MAKVSPTDLILIDTCIWVPYFNRPQSAERRTVDTLLDEDRGAITGMILAEVLQGFHRDQQADWVASRLARLGSNLGRLARRRATGKKIGRRRTSFATDGPRDKCHRLQTRLRRLHG